MTHKYNNIFHGEPIFACSYNTALNVSLAIDYEAELLRNTSAIPLIWKASPQSIADKTSGMITAQVPNGTGGTSEAVVFQGGHEQIFTSPADGTWETVKMDRPGALFDPFTKSLKRDVCASTGFAYEFIFKDFSDSNYASSRSAIIQSLERLIYYKEALKRLLMKPLLTAFYAEIINRNLINTDYSVDYLVKSTKILFKPAAVLDPVKELSAHKMAMEMGIENRQIITELMGLGDYFTILQQKAREEGEIATLSAQYGANPGSVLSSGVTVDPTTVGQGNTNPDGTRS
jgi:hypothetical protein